jgi:alpha/beta hydrolase fold
MRVPTCFAVFALVVLTTSCGGGGSAGSAGSTAPSSATTQSASAPPNPMATPAVDGSYVVASDGRHLALRCWGKGTPVVVMDPGDESGIEDFESMALTADLATHDEVCAYYRAGGPNSDPAPNRKRTLDDIVSDLHGLLAAAKVPGPYVMVGASGGGFDVYHYAGRHPDQVVGLVLLDTPPGQAKMSAQDRVDLAWDNPGNPEHVDYPTVEHQMAVARLPIPRIPVTVITAKDGQSADHPAGQRVWLAGSSHPVQVVLQGGHEIANDAPDQVAAQVEKVITLARASR